MSRSATFLFFTCLLAAQSFAQDVEDRHLQAIAISNNNANAIGAGNTAIINSATGATSNGFFPGATTGFFPGGPTFFPGTTAGAPILTASSPKKGFTTLPAAQTLIAAPVAQPAFNNLTPVVPITSPVLQNIIANVQKKLFGPPGPTVVVVKKPQTAAVAPVVVAAPPPKK
eukprot:GILK01014322.1.p1 GENE.GILK01014322.1~~GILK01014322.1.p1  ORF type:complete len:171 (+),score=25.23 GILK01014322.1:302-814(+)